MARKPSTTITAIAQCGNESPSPLPWMFPAVAAVVLRVVEREEDVFEPDGFAVREAEEAEAALDAEAADSEEMEAEEMDAAI
jgi:hypothetical protein